MALAAFVHCLVVWLGKEQQMIKRSSLSQKRHCWYVRHNLWNAARDGIEGMLIVDESGKKSMIREDLDRILEALRPIAISLNCLEELGYIQQMIAQGSSATRQLKQFAQQQSYPHLVETLVEEFRSGIPSWSETLV
jgi:carboxylate-amine ligase